MGAFGRLMQRHLGGTVHDVITWSNVQRKGCLNSDRINGLYCKKCKTHRNHKLHVYKNDKIRTKNEDWFCTFCDTKNTEEK